MAKIDLNNLVRPKQINSSDTNPSKQVVDVKSVYTDIHLDLAMGKTIGHGGNDAPSNDILVDTDILAIRNSIKNIFTTKKGEKILAPEFGSALEQFLFEPVDNVYGRIIGETIFDNIKTYEPRVEITNINVITKPDENLYQITIQYKFLEIKKQSSINILALQGGELLF
jgi:phage baseplate assembly protein W